MAGEREVEDATRGEGTPLLVGLGFVTLTALVLGERFAEVPPVLAAYAGALYVLGRGSTR